MIKRVTYTYSVTVPANSEVVITGADFGITEIVGYSIVAINRFNTGSVGLMCRQISPSYSGNVMAVVNITNSPITRTVTVGFVFAKTNFVS